MITQQIKSQKQCSLRDAKWLNNESLRLQPQRRSSLEPSQIPTAITPPALPSQSSRPPSRTSSHPPSRKTSTSSNCSTSSRRQFAADNDVPPHDDVSLEALSLDDVKELPSCTEATDTPPLPPNSLHNTSKSNSNNSSRRPSVTSTTSSSCSSVQQHPSDVPQTKSTNVRSNLLFHC